MTRGSLNERLDRWKSYSHLFNDPDEKANAYSHEKQATQAMSDARQLSIL